MKSAIVGFGLILGLVSLSACLDPSEEARLNDARAARDQSGSAKAGRSDRGSSPANAGSDRVSRSKERVGKGSVRH